MVLDRAQGPLLVPTEVRVTHTPLGGAADTPIEELLHKQRKRVKSVSVSLTQTIENQEGLVSLWNDDGLINDWDSGDGLKIETRPVGQAGYSTILDGMMGSPKYASARGRSEAAVTVRGWTALLDLTNLDEDLSYDNMALTSIADALITEVLGAGFGRSITADAATVTNLRFAAGTKLREVLDIVRRALNTGADKWEHVVEVVAGVKTYRLYKRTTTIQRTVKARDLLIGSEMDKGDVAEVVNKARVTGATVPTIIDDDTDETRVAYLRMAATTSRIAFPFTPGDSPVSSVQFHAERSTSLDPPTLTFDVARNSTVRNILGSSPFEGSITALKRAHSSILSGHLAHDPATLQQLTMGTDVGELVAYDLGATPPTLYGAVYQGAPGTGNTIVVEYSDDDSAWTTVASGAAADYFSAYFASAETHRYWRCRWPTSDGGVSSIRQFTLLAYKNTSADATNPIRCQDGNNSSTATTVSTTGAQEKVLAQFDFGSVTPIIRVEARHSESVASALVVLKIQYSNAVAPGANDWTDYAELDSTTTAVEDSFFTQDAGFRHLRVIVDDDRPAASAALTTNLWEIRAYEHTSDVFLPMTSDTMRGGTQSWDVTSLIDHPGVLEARTFSAPRLALIANEPYWTVLKQSAAATSKSFWDLSLRGSIDLTNLVGFWSFDERSGTIARDGIGNHNVTWTDQGSIVWMDGKIGSCLSWGGAAVSTNPAFADSADIELGSACTIAFWIFPVNLTNKIAVVGKANPTAGATQEAWGVYVKTDGTVEFQFKSVTVKTSTSAAAVVAGQWNHVVIRYDGADVKIRVNNGADTTTAQTGAIASTTSIHDFGRFRDMAASAIINAGRYCIDDLYIFTAAISDARATALYGYTSPSRVMRSEDSGLTWFAVPGDLNLMQRFEYNEHQLEGTAEDAASQVTYASLVPGGILYGSIVDQALLSQDAVDKEALALVNRRKAPPRRIKLVIPLAIEVVPGPRVALAVEAAQRLGLSELVELDVLNVNHELGQRAVTVLDCDEYPVATPQAVDATAAYATQRRI